VSGCGKPSLRCSVPIEVSSLSGVATPYAIGVVILYFSRACADDAALESLQNIFCQVISPHKER
jgi:hypothetical protein